MLLHLVKLVVIFHLILHQLNPISGYTTHVLLETPRQFVSRNNPDIFDYTIHLHNYGFIGSLTSFINFKIKGSNSAAVFLLSAESMGPTDDCYIVRFGENHDSNRQLFYKSNKTSETELLIDVFENETDYDSMLPFYVRWDNGTIKAGDGTVENENYFLSWEDKAFNVRSVAICTLWDELGRWDIAVEAQFSGFFSTCKETNIRGNMAILYDVITLSQVHCALICAGNKECSGYNYHDYEKKCEIISTGQLVVESHADGWNFYRKCIAKHRGCQCK